MTDDGEIRRIGCAICDLEAEAYGDSSGVKTIKCPRCGRSDTLEDAVADVARGMIAKALGPSSQTGGEFFSIKVTTTPHAPRWKFMETGRT